jgi:chromosome segregation ATPase
MNQESQISNIETLSDLKRIKSQLRSLRKQLRECKALIPHSQSAIEQLDIEVAKSFQENKKGTKRSYATACFHHQQLLSLQRRLSKDIYELKTQKERLETRC